MNILLVEDNKTIAENIKKYLSLEDMKVDIANDGNAGLRKFQQSVYDFVLLDIMMPGMDGFELCKEIRRTRDVPILMLTAKSGLEDKLQGFDCGADDYLVKPFDLEELLARIKTIVRRLEYQDKFVYKDIEVLLDKKEVLKGGKPVNITIKEFTLLEFLIQNVGIAVSRTDILDYVWGDDLFESDSKLDVYISQLRKKLDKNMIQTIKGFGYMIEK